MTKENFLIIYSRAWIRTATPEVVKSAFEKTGVWPLNRNRISMQVMAPSQETSYRGSLLFTPPSPVHAVAEALSQSQSSQKRPRAGTPSSSSSSDAEEENINPLLRTLKHTMASSSLAFLTSSEPIQSTSHLPDFNHPPIPPIPPLRIPEPVMENERILAERLNAMQTELLSHRTTINDQRAMILLQSEYSVRHQLATSEQKAAKPSGHGRLNADGMPKVLTADACVARVKEHEAAQVTAASEKVERRLECERRTTEITARYEAAVEEWCAEQEQARAERRRARWKKPERKEFPLLPKIPKPPARKRAKQVEVDEEEDEESSSVEE